MVQKTQQMDAKGLALVALEVLGTATLYVGVIGGLFYQVGRAAGYLG